MYLIVPPTSHSSRSGAPEAQVLKAVVTLDKPTVPSISEAVGMVRTTIRKAAVNLEASGWLEQKGEHRREPTGRPARVFRLTDDAFEAALHAARQTRQTLSDRDARLHDKAKVAWQDTVSSEDELSRDDAEARYIGYTALLGARCDLSSQRPQPWFGGTEGWRALIAIEASIDLQVTKRNPA